MSEQKWFPGETYGTKLKFTDEDGNYFDPTEVTITIKNPSGESKATLNLSDLTKESTGIYKMYWDIPANAETGIWKIIVQAKHPTGKIGKEEFIFEVLAE